MFLAASGDKPGTFYPSISPNVIAVGGTTINRYKNGKYLGESPWKDGGAGSGAAMRPQYQKVVAGSVKTRRGVVDLSAVADPAMGGVYFYNENNNNDLSIEGWAGAGGTSVATAIVAGIIHNAGRFASTSQQQLTAVYSNINSSGQISKNFHDISEDPALSSTGCGVNGTQYKATKGWDFCTGVGTPNGRKGFYEASSLGTSFDPSKTRERRLLR